MSPHHLAGVAEVAALLGVSRQRVGQLAATYPDFPEPEVELAGGRIWAREAIESWRARHPTRAPGRAPGTEISFERFTERSRQALVVAQQQARELGHDYVGCEHLLLGLLADRDAVAARALGAPGVRFDGARDALQQLLGSRPPAGAEHLPFTPRVRRALELAQEAASEFRHDYIGTEHLLLGILHEGENVGCRLLVQAGVDLAALRLGVLEVMGFPQPSTEPGAPDHGAPPTETLIEALLGRLERIDARLDSLEHLLT